MTAITTVSLVTDVTRLRSEFLSFPGLCLTVAQTARLLDVRRDDAIALLETLEDEGLLIQGTTGLYRRASPPFS